MIPSFGTIPFLEESLPAYFSMMMIAFAVTISLGARWAKQSGLDHDVVIDVGLVCLSTGMIGALCRTIAKVSMSPRPDVVLHRNLSSSTCRMH